MSSPVGDHEPIAAERHEVSVAPLDQLYSRVQATFDAERDTSCLYFVGPEEELLTIRPVQSPKKVADAPLNSQQVRELFLRQVAPPFRVGQEDYWINLEATPRSPGRTIFLSNNWPPYGASSVRTPGGVDVCAYIKPDEFATATADAVHLANEGRRISAAHLVERRRFELRTFMVGAEARRVHGLMEPLMDAHLRPNPRTSSNFSRPITLWPLELDQAPLGILNIEVAPLAGVANGVQSTILMRGNPFGDGDMCKVEISAQYNPDDRRLVEATVSYLQFYPSRSPDDRWLMLWLPLDEAQREEMHSGLRRQLHPENFGSLGVDS